MQLDLLHRLAGELDSCMHLVKDSHEVVPNEELGTGKITCISMDHSLAAIIIDLQAKFTVTISMDPVSNGSVDHFMFVESGEVYHKGDGVEVAEKFSGPQCIVLKSDERTGWSIETITGHPLKIVIISRASYMRGQHFGPDSIDRTKEVLRLPNNFQSTKELLSLFNISGSRTLDILAYKAALFSLLSNQLSSVPSPATDYGTSRTRKSQLKGLPSYETP